MIVSSLIMIMICLFIIIQIQRSKKLITIRNWHEWYAEYNKQPTFAKQNGWKPTYQKVSHPDKPLKQDNGMSLTYHVIMQLKKDYTQSLKDSVG